PLIDEACERLLQGPWDAPTLTKVHREAHNLAGFGATFGFPVLGDAARALEIQLQTLDEAGGLPTDGQRRRLGELLVALKGALAEAPSSPPIFPVPRPSARPSGAARGENRTVSLAEPD